MSKEENEREEKKYIKRMKMRSMLAEEIKIREYEK